MERFSGLNGSTKAVSWSSVVTTVIHQTRRLFQGKETASGSRHTFVFIYRYIAVSLGLSFNFFHTASKVLTNIFTVCVDNISELLVPYLQQAH
jgi:hypothetical protein